MEKYTKLTHEDFIQIMNQVDNSLEIQRRIYKYWQQFCQRYEQARTWSFPYEFERYVQRIE